jgi:hypothetical protein
VTGTSSGFAANLERKASDELASKICSQGWNRVCDFDNEKFPKLFRDVDAVEVGVVLVRSG